VNTGIVPGECTKVQDGLDNRVSSLFMDAGLICTVYCKAECKGTESAVLGTQDNPDFATLKRGMVSSPHAFGKRIPDSFFFQG
jgi:hypothetical protein